MALVYTGFAPHPPIVVPEVGRGDEKTCAATAQGLDMLAQRIVEADTDILIIVSPHAPRAQAGLAYLEGNSNVLEGDLSSFSAPTVKFSLETAPEVLDSLQEFGAKGVLADRKSVV
jgi:aromatic ring-opening dioxygenase LigB subunit